MIVIYTKQRKTGGVVLNKPLFGLNMNKKSIVHGGFSQDE